MPVNKVKRKHSQAPEWKGDRKLPISRSCSECRRLRVRCDRKWPCQSCVKRGCASICPNGTLTPGGPNNRYILHGSEELYERLSQMSERILQLEDYISSMSNGSQGTHHLLTPELLRIKQMPDTQNAEECRNTLLLPDSHDDEMKPLVQPAEETRETESIQQHVGTLTLEENGASRYLGRSARLELLIPPEKEHSERPGSNTTTFSQNDASGSVPHLPDNIRHIAESLVFSVPPNCTVTIETLKEYLPSVSRAWSLCDIFFEHAGWFYKPMSREDFVEDILSDFYCITPSTNTPSQAPESRSQSESETMTRKTHNLAILFSVFGVGEIVDLKQDPVRNLSRQYHTLAKVALCIENPFQKGGSLAFIQATILMVLFSSIWDQQLVHEEEPWLLIGIAVKMAFNLGLHRDAAAWGFSDKELQKRRLVFWELLSFESWHSLSFGRPSVINWRHVDCKLPERERINGKNEFRVNGQIQQSRNALVCDCLLPLSDHIFSVEPFPYSNVTDLDSQIRKFDLRNLKDSPGQNPSGGAILERHTYLGIKEFLISFVHRGLFTRVLATNPDNPLETPYAASVLATFRCAITLLKLVNSCYQKVPSLTSRFGLAWSYLLTSAVIMGSVCTRAPRCVVSPAAFSQLMTAVGLFKSSLDHSPRNARIMTIVIRLQNKSLQAIQSVSPGPTSRLPLAENSAIKVATRGKVHSNGLIAYGGISRVVHRPTTIDQTSPNSPSQQLAPQPFIRDDPATVHPLAPDARTPDRRRSAVHNTSVSRTPGEHLLTPNTTSSHKDPFNFSTSASQPTCGANIPALGLLKTGNITPFGIRESFDPSPIVLSEMERQPYAQNDGVDVALPNVLRFGVPVDQSPNIGAHVPPKSCDADVSYSDSKMIIEALEEESSPAIDALLKSDAACVDWSTSEWENFIQNLFLSPGRIAEVTDKPRL